MVNNTSREIVMIKVNPWGVLWWVFRGQVA